MALTAKERKDRLNSLMAYWQANVDPMGNGAKHGPTEKLKNLWLKNLSWGWNNALVWMRHNDKDQYLSTNVAQARIQDIKDLYQMSFGPNYKPKGKLERLIRLYGLADPAKVQKLEKVFSDYIMRTAEFKKENPGFRAFMDKNFQLFSAGNPITGVGAYRTLRKSFLDKWSELGTGKEIPESLLTKAIVNDWNPSGEEWTNAVWNTSEYVGSTTVEQKGQQFDREWAAVFGETEVDPSLRSKYLRAAATGATFEDFFQSTLKSSAAFTTAFPDYAAWEATVEKTTGAAEGTVSVSDYIKQRRDYTDAYKSIMETADGVPDPKLIAQAMKENWSMTQWELELKTRPEFSNTAAGANKAADFDRYWKGLFGDASLPNQNLKDRFVAGTITDPSTMWQDIKKTAEFDTQFSQWDTFAAAQNTAGNSDAILNDPNAYKQYQDAFTQSFANIGMQVPLGLDKQIFASGVSASDIASNVDTYAATRNSYQTMTGGRADLATAIGAGDRVAGGDLRTRLKRALEEHKAFINSSFNAPRVEQQQGSGLITQKI